MPAPKNLRDWRVDEVIEAMDGVSDEMSDALMRAVPNAYEGGDGVSMNVAWPKLDPALRAKLKAVADAVAAWWESDCEESIKDWVARHVDS